MSDLDDIARVATRREVVERAYRGKRIPEYDGIKTGARLIQIVGLLFALFGIFVFLIPCTPFLDHAFTMSLPPAFESIGLFALMIILSPIILGSFVISIFLMMISELALAVRDTAINSFY